MLQYLEEGYGNIKSDLLLDIFYLYCFIIYHLCHERVFHKCFLFFFIATILFFFNNHHLDYKVQIIHRHRHHQTKSFSFFLVLL